MSGEKVKVVRRPMRATARAHRSPEERLGLRFPRLLAFAARLVWRQPVRTLRRAATRRSLRLAWEAFNRGDYEATFMLYGADTESVGADVWGTIGAEMRTRGRADRIAYQRTILEEWEALRFEPEETIEVGGDRLVSVGRMAGRGRASGATVDTPWAVVLAIEDGTVSREAIFVDRDEALEAAGLSEWAMSQGVEE
jgi:ketosteroid isomerase-like protein